MILRYDVQNLKYPLMHSMFFNKLRELKQNIVMIEQKEILKALKTSYLIIIY